eukprot:41400_1
MSKVCYITPDFIRRVSRSPNLLDVRSLNVHSGRKSADDTKIRTIECLEECPNLEDLNLSYNLIGRIENLGSLSCLTHLNLSENTIRRVEGVVSLKNLVRLNLSGNQIERIPPSIKNLTKLEVFRISKNKLSQLSDLLHLGALKGL